MSFDIPFHITDWSLLPTAVVNGVTGRATMRTQLHGDLRIRMVDYSANYLADHWCELGHLVFVIEGELINEHQDGTINVLRPGMSYQVSDKLRSHRSRTIGPVKLLIVDGAFLS